MLATVLVASHTTAVGVHQYPHYVLLILFHPPVLRRLFGVRLATWQVAWISGTLFAHPMGGLNRWYATVWWYDHLTHFASATLVASIGFVLARSQERRSADTWPRWTVPLFTMAFVMTAGHAWEVFETYTPFLTVYGPNDTFWDYVFDALGGLTVVALGDRLLGNVVSGIHSETTNAGADDVTHPG